MGFSPPRAAGMVTNVRDFYLLLCVLFKTIASQVPRPHDNAFEVLTRAGSS